ANLANTLLYGINGGEYETAGAQVGPTFEGINSEVLEYDEVFKKFHQMMDWRSGVYIDSLNIIHYMHEKCSYE
ncbi:pyruvate formate lyase family protein, partial [Staphylococcus aureus]